MTDRSELLGRGAELAALAAAADRAAAGAGQALLVEGPAGIGKTALADAARAFAAQAGLTPLRARGTELERAFGFGVVRQLLEPAVHGAAATPPLAAAPEGRVSGAGRDAGATSRGFGDDDATLRPAPRGADATSVSTRAGHDAGATPRGSDTAHGHDDATSRPAPRGPDAASVFTGAARQVAALLDVELPDAPLPPGGPEAAQAIVHGLYRLTANLAARRPLALFVDDAHWADGASLRFLAYLSGRLRDLPVLLVVAARPPGEPGNAEVASLLSEAPLHLNPLSADEAARLVREAVPEAPDALCARCSLVTGGNPFFLRELAAALRDVGPGGADAVLEAAPHGVVAAIRSRLGRFDASARALAGAAAVLGDGALLRHAASVAELGESAAATAADALRGGRILTPDRRLSFVHAIVRAAVHEELAPGARAAGHARAAQLLAAEDATPERVAAHLLDAEPAASAWACERLREAAREALPRGAPDASVTYLRRALLEPPEPGDRPAVLLELGLAEALTLDLEPAIEHLRRGVETTPDPFARLYAARMLSSLVGIDRPADGVAILERALAASPDADPALAVHIEGHLVNIARFDLSSRAATRSRAERLRARVERGELDGPMELTVAATEAAMDGGTADRVAELAERAIDGLRADPLLAITLAMAVRCLGAADRLPRAEQVLQEALEDARARHATYRIGPLLGMRSDVRLRAGALEDAEADAEAALTIYRGGGRMGELTSTAWLVQALTDQGKLDAAEAALAAAGELDDSYPGLLLRFGRGQLRLARGDTDAGLEDLLDCGRRERVMGERNPALMEWRSQAAPALARLGQREQAVALAEEELELARAFGAPRALGIALRACGVLDGGDAGLPRLRASVDVLEGSPALLERARSQAQLGIALRRARRIADAREPLRVAADLARRCGARPLEELARSELQIAGGRPRRIALTGTQALTINERRVASLAAGGSSNREIAESLFVSRKTVEKHLTAAYQKLGIHARAELPGALAKE